MTSARDRIAERVKNAYAAGHNDGRKGPDRMDEVAETEADRIIEIVREEAGEYRNYYRNLLSEQPGWEWMKAAGVLKDKLPDIPSEEIVRRLRSGEDIWQDGESAFGADDDGVETAE